MNFGKSLAISKTFYQKTIHPKNIQSNTKCFSQKTITQHFLVEYNIPFLVGQSSLDDNLFCLNRLMWVSVIKNILTNVILC